MNLFALGTQDDGAAFANHVLDEVVGAFVSSIEVVVAEVDGDVEALDVVGRVEAHFHIFGMGAK